MPKKLSAAQIASYEKDGFCCPIDVLSAAEADGVRQALEETEARHPEALNPQNRNNAHLVFPFLDQIVHHPAILDAAEDLIGADILVWGTVLFIKNPHDPGYVSWHQDATYMGLEPHVGVSAWLALTPSTVENGCMRMQPGSHKADIQPHKDTFGDENILTRGQTIEGLDDSAAVDLVLQPGQMSLHHPRVIHGSQPNQSAQRRIGVVIQSYLPPGVRQTLGEGYVQLARGQDDQRHSTHIARPGAALEPDAVAQRERVNQAWADMLYKGAERKRAF